MRVLGILGGMAWPSTAEAYRLINLEVQRRLGGTHSAPLILWSFDFAEIERMQEADDWATAGRLLAETAVRLEAAGAEGLLLCTNTMHLVAPAIEAAISIPLLHVADATARAIRDGGQRTVGLLGTAFTMERDFYRGRLEEHGLKVLVPDAAGRALVHRIIFEELVHGEVHDGSREREVHDGSREHYREVVADLVDRGAEGVIAGCTEIELLLRPEDVEVAYYPTTRLHTLAAVDWILDTSTPG